jgi:hypothetical protein
MRGFPAGGSGDSISSGRVGFSDIRKGLNNRNSIRKWPLFANEKIPIKWGF